MRVTEWGQMRFPADRYPSWILIAGGSAAIAIAICTVTGLIPTWGQWYSVNPAYRRQTEALLSGSFALDTDPGRLGYDMAWAEGGVQQVWGLGVPAWRLPFEAAAKLVGGGAFPDRIAFAVALAITIYVLIKLLVLNPPGARLTAQPERFVGAALLILFPPFLILCSTKFDVYEEAQAYMYLTGLGLFAATLWFIRTPGLVRYAVLGSLAGLSPFVRPTLLAYGLASVLIGWIFARQRNWPQRRLWIGPGAFVMGCALLLLTNAYRFGSPMEFGHSLNLNVNWAMMYATRIENPVAHAPLLGRLAELFSYLFLLRNDLNCCNGYAADILAGQAPVARWRDIYFSTYDLTFLALIGVAWVASFYVLRFARGKAENPEKEAATMAAWSLLGCAPLFVLYLWYPVMSSRYMMDFAPGFAVALWAILQLAAALARAKFAAAPKAVSALCVAAALWWGYQVATAQVFPHTGGGVAARPPAYQKADLSKLDTNTYLPSTDFESYRLPFNGYGWFAENDWIASLVVLFVRDPDIIELDLSGADGASLTERDWSRVRVKVGLEWLALQGSTPTATGRRLAFARASRPKDRGGIEVAFIALASRHQTLDRSKFSIDAVRWYGGKGDGGYRVRAR